MAEFVVELGAVVVVVAAAVGVEEEPSEDPLDEDDAEPVPEVVDPEPVDPEPVDPVELTGDVADAVTPGISLETTRPSAAAAPVARRATALDVRRTLAPARSRRSA